MAKMFQWHTHFVWASIFHRIIQHFLVSSGARCRGGKGGGGGGPGLVHLAFLMLLLHVDHLISTQLHNCPISVKGSFGHYRTDKQIKHIAEFQILRRGVSDPVVSI